MLFLKSNWTLSIYKKELINIAKKNEKKGNKIEIIDNLIYIYPTNSEELYFCDIEHYDLVKQYTWHQHKRYLETNILVNNKYKTKYLHQLIVKENPKSNEKIIFIDGNWHNCTNNNLKIQTKYSHNFSKPSKIIEKDDYIIVIANNTKNEHIFPKSFQNILQNIAWSEDKNGHLGSVIFKNCCIKAYWFVVGQPLNNLVVDHIDGNPRNNMPENLRITTKSINCQNKKLLKTNTSGFVGMYWNKRDNIWQVAIGVNNKKIYLGRYSNIIDAAQAYDKAAIKYFGEYATTNVKLNRYEEYYNKMQNPSI